MNIGQAAKASGVSAKMLRYYESIGLIPPAERTASGYRVYSPADIATLQFIKRARTLGFSIDRIQILVGLWHDKDRASAEVKDIALAHVGELKAKIVELKAMRDTLQELAEACNGDDRPDCPILKDLAGGLATGARRRRASKTKPVSYRAGRHEGRSASQSKRW